MQKVEDKLTTRPVFGLLAAALLPVLLCMQSPSFAVVSGSDEAWFDVPEPDQSDWSSKRLTRHAELDYSGLGEPIAVIRVPDLKVAAQVFPDGHKQALEAGAAWVSITSRPGETGNIAIAGHRDSFFRPLEGIPLGTQISLTTAETELQFAVTSVEIVDPLDLSPLASTETTTLTLITCHPFRYQGFAPDRYIIRAELFEAPRTQAEPADSALRTFPAN